MGPKAVVKKFLHNAMHLNLRVIVREKRISFFGIIRIVLSWSSFEVLALADMIWSVLEGTLADREVEISILLHGMAK